MSTTPQGMSVHTLGTGGGPIVSSSRAGTSTAIASTTLSTWWTAEWAASATTDPAPPGANCGVFLTHHHSDHVYDLGSFLVTGWQVPGESFSRQIQILGSGSPERVPALDDEHAGQITAGSATASMTGTCEMVGALLEKVFASDICIRMADEGPRRPARLGGCHRY